MKIDPTHCIADKSGYALRKFEENKMSLHERKKYSEFELDRNKLIRTVPIWAAFIVLTLVFSGCMTPSQQLDPDSIARQLQKGQTQDEVRRVFGQPTSSEAGSNGKRLDVYRTVFRRGAAEAPSRILEVRSLNVLYDSQGRVEDFSYHTGQAKAVGNPTTQQWQAGRWLGPDQINKIQRGKTSREELIRLFGPATTEGLNVNGQRMMLWFFIQSERRGAVSGQQLAVLLDSKAVTQDFGVRELQL
jgi:outer membrane protein assembly factor BamE (lipoprotein component of BamABCDE complex)